MSKQKLNMSILLMLMLVMMFVSACGNNSNNEGSNDSAGSEEKAVDSDGTKNNMENNTEESAEDSTVEEVVDPFGKYEQAIELTTARFVRDGVGYPEGDDIHNNVWYRAYEDILGIKLTNKWVSSSNADVRDQKMSVAIASGELPDFFEVNARELQLLVEADLIQDLTEAYEKYATPMIKENWSLNGGLGLQAATYNGKLMALPGSGGGGINNAQMIWLRMDWLENLDLEPPKTMEDVLNIAEAFTNEDPDQDGEDDTFGLALVGGTLYDGFAGIDGFMNGYHAYPYNRNGATMWIKDDTGKLVYGGIQPEVKEALKKLNEMFEAGLIDPEFAVKTGSQVSETVVGEKIGLYFGEFFNASWPLNQLHQQNENAQWQPFPLVSVDEQPAEPAMANPVPSKYYVVHKDVEHPEAVVKMLNLYMEKIYGKTAEPDVYHTVEGKDEEGNPVSIQVHGKAAIISSVDDNNIQGHIQVTEAIRNNDPSGLKPEFKNYYDAITKYFNDEEGGSWGLERTFGEVGAFSIIKQYVDQDLGIPNEFYGGATPTMTQVGSTLHEMELEIFTKIIMGAAPIEEFDKFVSDWNQLGGEQITQEINEWVENKK